MGSNGASGIAIPGQGKSECSETTVEIKIKTLDSQTYTLRVNKCVSVPALKEQIASVTGVLSEQQRLICQGKVLKDDQLLSAYHVEDGHTLHLVVRQPAASFASGQGFIGSGSLNNIPDNSAAHSGRSFTFRTINLTDQGDPATPYLNRILSSVTSSLGLGNISLGIEREQDSESGSRTSEDGNYPDPFLPQVDRFIARARLEPQEGDFQFLNATSAENQSPAVIPDSLTTLNQYSCHMRHDFQANVRALRSNSQVSDIYNDEAEGHNSQSQSTARQGLPTPASLAEVILSTRQLLVEHAGGCLSELATQLQGQDLVTDSHTRANIQTNAVRSGVLFQNLGSLLLELGRAIMTLRMGQSSAEAVVNAGPAMFVSASGPTRIMVQAGSNFNGIPMGVVQSGGLAGGLVSGPLSRNIDIRIHRVTANLLLGHSVPIATAMTEQSDRQQPSDLERNSGGIPIHQAFHRELNSESTTQEPRIRVVPIRTVVAVPAGVSRPPSDFSHGRLGLHYSLLARVVQQNLQSNHGLENSQASTARNTSEANQHPVPGSVLQTHLETSTATVTDQNPLSTSSASAAPLRPSFQLSDSEQGTSGLNRQASSNTLQNDIAQLHEGQQSGQESVSLMMDRISQLLETIDAEPIHTTERSPQEAAIGFAPVQVAIATDAQEREDNDGVLFSGLVQQIMPFISQGTTEEQSGVLTSSPSSSSDHVERPNTADAGDCRDPPDDPASKRQKIE